MIYAQQGRGFNLLDDLEPSFVTLPRGDLPSLNALNLTPFLIDFSFVFQVGRVCRGPHSRKCFIFSSSLLSGPLSAPPPFETPCQFVHFLSETVALRFGHCSLRI